MHSLGGGTLTLVSLAIGADFVGFHLEQVLDGCCVLGRPLSGGVWRSSRHGLLGGIDGGRCWRMQILGDAIPKGGFSVGGQRRKGQGGLTTWRRAGPLCWAVGGGRKPVSTVGGAGNPGSRKTL